MSKAEKAPNYTQADTDFIVERYTAGNTVAEIAAMFDPARKPRSVQSKLVQLKVYKAVSKSVKPVSAKDEGPSKKELQAKLEALGVNTKGSDGATKDFLSEILVRLTPAAAEPVAEAA